MKIVDREGEKVEKNTQQKQTKVDNNLKWYPINDLPSKNKFYPEGTQILGRRLTVPEVKKLADINDSNFDFIQNDILQNSIKGIVLDDLKVMDKFYLILWLRANTFLDNSFKMPITCNNQECNNKIEHHFKLEDIEVFYLKDDFKNVLKIGDDDIIINFQSIKDEKEVDKILEKDEKDEIDDEDMELVSNIKINDMDLMQKYNYVRNLDPQDYIKLKQYIDNNQFGINPFINVKCKKCGGTADIAVRFCHTFFMPKYKS